MRPEHPLLKSNPNCNDFLKEYDPGIGELNMQRIKKEGSCISVLRGSFFYLYGLGCWGDFTLSVARIV